MESRHAGAAIVLNPADFSDIRLARENSATGTLGGYLMGPPSQAAPPRISPVFGSQ